MKVLNFTVSSQSKIMLAFVGIDKFYGYYFKINCIFTSTFENTALDDRNK